MDRDAMILQYLPLVQRMAQRFSGLTCASLDLEDLVQEGVIGLHRAADLYDPAHRTRFSTYATWWVRKAILRAIETRGRAIRLPAHASEAYRRMRAARQQAAAEGRNPTLEELADAGGVSVERAATILRMAEAPLSLDEPVGEDGDRLGEVLAVAEPEDRSDLRDVRALVDQLPKPLRQVILLRFWQELKPDAAAQVLGLSRQGVLLRQARALQMLREMWGDMGAARPAASHARRAGGTGRLGHAEREEICRRYEAGNISQAALAREYGVSRARVNQIVRHPMPRG
jgi:RNA polymerase primary sigma factor